MSDKFCSFCGASQQSVKAMVAAAVKAVYICDECVQTCIDVLREQEEKKMKENDHWYNAALLMEDTDAQ